MLQTVIGDDYICAQFNRFARSSDSFGMYNNGTFTLCGKQHRLVTNHRGIALCCSSKRRSAYLAAISPTDYARRHSLFPKGFRQPDSQRCFSRSADGDVANNNDGYSNTYGP